MPRIDKRTAEYRARKYILEMLTENSRTAGPVIAKRLGATVPWTRKVLERLVAEGRIKQGVALGGIDVYSLIQADVQQVSSGLQFTDLRGYTSNIMRDCETRMALRGAGWRL